MFYKVDLRVGPVREKGAAALVKTSGCTGGLIAFRLVRSIADAAEAHRYTAEREIPSPHVKNSSTECGARRSKNRTPTLFFDPATSYVNFY